MKKLREQGGYSLTESLCVVIVLLLITAVLMTGMHFATDTFAKSVSQSEAQVLCSTLKTVVTNELKNASEVKLDGSQNVQSFFSTLHGGAGARFGNLEGELTVEQGGNSHKLLSSTSYTYGTKASIDEVKYHKATGSFHVKLTVSDQNDKEIKSMEFDVLPVTPPKITA